MWKRIKREELLPKLRAGGGGGAAGFGIRRVGRGYWIGLQDMFERGAAVAKDMEGRQAELRSAPFVIVDVRGNGGGSSDVGTRIASVLWGAERAKAIGGDDDDCSDDLRASVGNVADMEFLMQALGATFSPEYKTYLGQQIVAGHDAITHRRSFNRPPIFRPRRPSASIQAVIGQTGGASSAPRILLVTDNLCFSSCLVLTDDFRRLGEVQLGQTTDAATHFTQVREQYLPSGYSLFSTLQSVSPGEPPNVGPFIPDRMYSGDISDTATVERWVLRQLGQR